MRNQLNVCAFLLTDHSDGDRQPAIACKLVQLEHQSWAETSD